MTNIQTRYVLVDQSSEHIGIVRNRKPSRRWLGILLCLAILGIFGNHTAESAAVEVVTVVVEQGAAPLPVRSCDRAHGEMGHVCQTTHIPPFIASDGIAAGSHRPMRHAATISTVRACLAACDIFHPPKLDDHL